MGNKNSLTLDIGEIRRINEETGFSTVQIEKLYNRFSQLDRNNNGLLTRAEFIAIPELATNLLCDRLVQMFFEQNETIDFRKFIQVFATFHTNNNNNILNSQNNDTGEVSNRERVRTVKRNQLGTNSTQHKLTTFDKGRTVTEGVDRKSDKLNDNLRFKLEFIFKIYDVNNDGRISFNDLRSVLELLVGNDIEDIQLDKIATRAFVELDEDSDGFVQFEEFCKVFNGEDLDEKLRVRLFG